MSECGSAGGGAGRVREPVSSGRGPYTFVLDHELVRRARREVAERDVVRSIEAALAAAIDYHVWMLETQRGERDPLS